MSYEPIAFPDVAAVVIGYLRDQLPEYGYDVPVHQATPNPRPDVFVTVRRGGGPKRDIVTDLPQINVECWSTAGEFAAGRLAETVRALIVAMRGRNVGGVGVYEVREFSGPAPLPDPENSGHPRYVQSFAVALRGAVLSPAD